MLGVSSPKPHHVPPQIRYTALLSGHTNTKRIVVRIVMEKLRRIPSAYLNDPRLADTLEGILDEIYGKMDRDGGRSFHAFSNYLHEVRRSDLARPDFFNEIDDNGDDKLDRDDVATLVYAVCSGRRFCRACDCFIEGDYFTCATCFHNNEQPYVLCVACHRNIRYHINHEHNDFLDNCVLLELLRRENLMRQTSNQASVPRSQASSSNKVNEVMPTQKSSSMAVCTAPPAHPLPQPFHWRDGLNVAGIGISAASLMFQQCSIM